MNYDYDQLPNSGKKNDKKLPLARLIFWSST